MPVVRVAVYVAPLVSELIEWMKQEQTKLSPHNDVVKAMNYMLKRTEAFTRRYATDRAYLNAE